MSAAYWSQFSSAELLSIHGLEIEDLEKDDEVDVEEERSDGRCHCSNCYDCLGLSPRDFW